MKQKLLTFLGVFLSFFAMAQNGKVTGIVKDSQSGEVLLSATISVKGSKLGTVTGSDGSFSISNVPVGKQTITASYIGYGSVSKQVDITANGSTNVDFSLEFSNVLGDEIVVSATRRPEKLTEAPASISVITAKDLDQLASFNVGELASKLQGVEFVRTGVNGVGINARGFNNAFNAKILAMTDGRNSMMAGGSGLAAGIMNTVIKEDIERIEVVLGPNSALYGPNAHNGVVNTITKDPRRYQGTTVAIDAGNQSVVSARLRHAMKLSDKFAFKVTGEYTQGNDFKFNDSVYVGNGTFYGPVRAVPEKIKTYQFSHRRAEAGLYYSVKPNADVIVSYGGSANDFLAVNNVGRNQIDDWKFSYLQTRYVSPRLFAQAYYTWTNVGNSYGIAPYTRDYTNRTNSTIPASTPGFGPIVGKLTPAEAEDFALRYGNKFKEKSGRFNGEVQYNNAWEKIGLNMVTSLSYQKDMPNTFGTSLADSDIPGTEGSNLITVEQFGGAVQLEKALPGKVKIVAAARLDNHSVFGNLFAPKIALVKTVNDGSFRLTYGRANAAPIILFQSANVFGIVFGNGNGISYVPNGANPADPAAVKVTDKLKVEQIGTWELGYKGVINKKLFVDINGYYGRTQNFLSPAISVGGRALKVGDIAIPTQNLLVGGTVTNNVLNGGLFSTYFNYGQVDAYGIDLGLNYYFTDKVSLGVRYSYFGSDITKDNIKNDANRDGFVSTEEKSLNTPKNRLATTLSFQNLLDKKLFINLSMRAVQKFDFYSGSQIATEAGAGKRGVVTATLPNGTVVNYLKNFDYGPLGGFTTFDISTGYALSKTFTVGAAMSNIFNVKQREFVGSPLIGRLYSIELKAHIPYKK
jgi:outer membrane receptor for ferrienterochelin and colicins